MDVSIVQANLSLKYNLHVVMMRQVLVNVHCLVGLVVKASASRAEDPGLESCLRTDFFGVESNQ